jgi:ribosomal protein S20
MAITSSAKKALRVSRRKRVFNLRRKNEIEKQIKAFRRLVTAKNKADAEKVIPQLYKALDKAVKTKYLKANTSARLKSRAMNALNKLGK